MQSIELKKSDVKALKTIAALYPKTKSDKDVLDDGEVVRYNMAINTLKSRFGGMDIVNKLVNDFKDLRQQGIEIRGR